MKTNNNVICPLPWHHFYFNSSGRVKACCISSESVKPVNEKTRNVSQFIKENRNHPHLVEVRKSWLRGEVPKTCQICIKDLGYKKIIHATWQTRNLEPCDTPIVNYPPRHIDYRFDKTCQAYCIMCVPSDSTKWDSIVKHNQKLEKWLNRSANIKVEVDYQWLYEADEIVYLNIAGGEPLLTDRNYDFLHDNMHKIQSLRFISNIHDVSDSIFDLIEKYKDKIKITISCDGLGDVYEYIRAGLSWSKFEKNYKRLCEVLPKDRISVNFVQMKHNEHQIEEFKKYFEGHYLIIRPVHNADHVHDPEFLELWHQINPNAKPISAS